MSSTSTSEHINEPIQDFSHCHEGILRKLDLLGELPALLAPDARARETAAPTRATNTTWCSLW